MNISPAVQYSSSPVYFLYMRRLYIKWSTGWEDEDEKNLFIFICTYIDSFLIQQGGERIGEEWSSSFGSHLVAIYTKKKKNNKKENKQNGERERETRIIH